jgi:hypothetical protein
MNEGSRKYYGQAEDRVYGDCRVESRKGLLQQPTNFIKAIVKGWIHPWTLYLAGLLACILLSTDNWWHHDTSFVLREPQGRWRLAQEGATNDLKHEPCGQWTGPRQKGAILKFHCLCPQSSQFTLGPWFMALCLFLCEEQHKNRGSSLVSEAGSSPPRSPPGSAREGHTLTNSASKCTQPDRQLLKDS